MDKRTIITIAAVALIVWAMPKWFNSGLPPNTFTMYYADWCPHCTTAKPEFAKLGATMTIDGTPVVIQAIEEQQISPDVKDKIKGFPTIQLVKPDGSVMEYSGERTTDGFQQFLKQNLS